MSHDESHDTSHGVKAPITGLPLIIGGHLPINNLAIIMRSLNFSTTALSLQI